MTCIGGANYKEMMALAAGRLIKNGDIVFAGTGLSILAATVAKRIHAPQATIFFETGGIDPLLNELPLAVADPRVMSGTCLNSSLIDAFSILVHRRLRTICFLGAAQVDPYGNINSTCLGNYHKPRVRLPGSGGACDAMSQAYAVILFMQHKKNRFVEKLDYLTSPGWLKGGDSRRKIGLQRGGPIAVVTNLGVMAFDKNTRRMYVKEIYSGVTMEAIMDNTAFSIDVSRAIQAALPTQDELKILREEIDPQRLILPDSS